MNGDEWFAIDEVLGYATDHGIISGYDDGRLGAYDNVTRGQVAVILHRLAGEPDAQADDFKDVDYNVYYGPAIRWARSAGVINGYWDENAQAYLNFGPDDAVTREQLATMLTNYADQVVGMNTDTYCMALDDMPDADDVDLWARDSVGWAMDMELMSGTVEADGAYVRPQTTAQRCAMAKMASVLHRDVLPPEVEDNATPITEYADNVITAPASQSSISEDGLTASVPTSALSDTVSEGSVVAVSDDGLSGTAIKAQSVITDGDRTIISGSQPDISEVYEHVAIEDIVDADEMSLTLEDGFEFANADEETSSIDGDDANLDESVNFGKFIKIKIKPGKQELTDATSERENAKVKAEITGGATITISPSLTYKIDYKNGSLNDVYLAIKRDFSISGDVGFSVKGEFKMARLSAGIVGADVNLVVNADGSISIKLSSGDETGYRYSNGKMKAMRKVSQPDLSLSVAASLKIGLGVSGDVSVLGFRIADCGATSGVAGSYQVTEHPTLECKNLDAYLFLTLDCGKKGLLKKLELSRSWDIFTSKNSPLKKSWHWEGEKLIGGSSDCTWGSKNAKTTDDGYKYIIAKDEEGWSEGEEFITYKDYSLKYHGEGAYILNYEGDSKSIKPPAYIEGQPVLNVVIQNEDITSLDMTDCGEQIESSTWTAPHLISYIDHSSRVYSGTWTITFRYAPQLQTIDISDSSTAQLKLGNLPRLQTIDASCSKIDTIWGFEGLPGWDEVEEHKLKIPRLSTLRTDGCSELRTIGLWGACLKDLDLSSNKALEGLTLKNCQLQTLNLPAETDIASINVSHNNLTTFKQQWLPGNLESSSYYHIDCSYNNILDTSNVEAWANENPRYRSATTQPQNDVAETAEIAADYDEDAEIINYSGPTGGSCISEGKIN